MDRPDPQQQLRRVCPNRSERRRTGLRLIGLGTLLLALAVGTSREVRRVEGSPLADLAFFGLVVSLLLVLTGAVLTAGERLRSDPR